MNRKNSLLRDDGMTLIEIIVVIVILGVLISFLTGGLFAKAGTAKAKLNEGRMNSVKQAIDLYRLTNNALPNSIDDLIKCNEKTGPGCTPALTADEAKDVWGNQLILTLENGGRTYKLKTFGEDGKEGGEGPAYDFSITGP